MKIQHKLFLAGTLATCHLAEFHSSDTEETRHRFDMLRAPSAQLIRASLRGGVDLDSVPRASSDTLPSNLPRAPKLQRKSIRLPSVVPWRWEGGGKVTLC